MSTIRSGNSIRKSLLYWTGALFLGLLALLSVGVNYYTRSVADYSYDRLLSSASLSMAEAIYVDGSTVYIDLPYAVFEMMQLASDDKVYYKITDHNGEFVSGYEDLPGADDQEPGNAYFFNTHYKGEKLRMVSQGELMTDPEVSGWINVLLGHGVVARQEMHLELFYRALVSVVGVMLFAMVIVWQVINHTLRPLQAISENLAKQSLSHSSPLSTTSIKEIAPLVERINDYHRRLRRDYDQMKNYIADASHQIRTGLSTTQAHLDLVRNTDDASVLRERLRTIKREHRRLTRLASQVLSHAMIIHRRDQASREWVDLGEELKSILTEFVRDHAQRDLSFAYRDEYQGEAIYADRISVREMMRNLIDNAIRYGPDDNRIDVTLQRQSDQCVAIVLDDAGTGIPAHLRRQALQRFSRLSSSVDGSGLGLAISDSVAKAHGGTVELGDSPYGGLRVRITFNTRGNASGKVQA